ncbi:hypothetical protein CQ017_06540 [Arthrobacter sp. MYb224]|nr:hypothetical protein CIK76_17710 [Glutamicibacter sp. BW80]PQZ99335.1 hypothetical protein CQ017_06540 [Arthrobacter sp. MYb224]PRA06185.1 hypothetical protein CQ019_01905 [Arthrobacter sp. MYb229]PRB53087.1 hypothetical protein CQ013_01905 [Arthrobacter sp. MYb216]
MPRALLHDTIARLKFNDSPDVYAYEQHHNRSPQAGSTMPKKTERLPSLDIEAELHRITVRNNL